MFESLRSFDFVQYFAQFLIQTWCQIKSCSRPFKKPVGEGSTLPFGYHFVFVMVKARSYQLFLRMLIGPKKMNQTDSCHDGYVSFQT